MTDIIKLAREAGIKNDCDGIWCEADQLRRFAELVAAPLKAENEALRVDAERYRCIRNPPYSDNWGDIYAMTFQRSGDMVLNGEQLDYAADAARAKEQTP